MKITKIRHTKIKNLVSISRDYLASDETEPPKTFICLHDTTKRVAIGDELFIALVNFSDISRRINIAKRSHLFNCNEPNVYNFYDWQDIFETWASHVLYWNDKAFNEGFPELVESKLLWAWKKVKGHNIEASPKTRDIFLPESQ